MSTDTTGTQALWPQMIAALAAIDAELGLPEDGCNSPARTLAAIRKLQATARSADTSALQADARRIDWLDAEARRPGGILLHAESETGRSGLGLGPRCGNRHLRKAISQAMGGEPPPAAPGGPAGARRPDENSHSGPSDRALNPQPEAVDHDRGAR